MLIIDRFEDSIAVCENGNKLEKIPISLIDPDAREGDVINIGEDGLYHLDREETDRRKANILKLLNNLWE